MSAYDVLKEKIKLDPKVWLITGVAGFIGSNLLEKLLQLDQYVIGLDNFATGYQHNLDDVKALVTNEQWNRFRFIDGDIRDIESCKKAVTGVDYVLHQAALGSVPRSLEDPVNTNSSNIDGFLNMLVAARDAQVKSFTYAASSSTYGDHPGIPKVEDFIGKPLSPYAVTKYVNELYAHAFSNCYGFNAIGLRYFNVFGKRQNPNGAYAAVIPRWISSMINGEPVFINGDGETSRDFCYVNNVVQANLLSATSVDGNTVNQIYNISAGCSTSLNQLYDYLRNYLCENFPHTKKQNPIYRNFRLGDVHHSLADISKATKMLGYMPTHQIQDGLKETIGWYCNTLSVNN